MKFSVPEIRSRITRILERQKVSQDKIQTIVMDLERDLSKVSESTADPVQKKQWVILISDPAGDLADIDMTGWVLQLPDDANPASVSERLIKAAYHYNTTPRGRKHPVKSIAETCEVVGAKLLKEHGTAVKTKLPVLVATTDNVLPNEATEKAA